MTHHNTSSDDCVCNETADAVGVSGEAVLRDTHAKYAITLYLLGMQPRSQRAIENVRHLCEEHLPGRYELTIVDMSQQPALAERIRSIAFPISVETASNDAALLSENDRPRPNREIAAPLLDDCGDLLGIVFLTRDIAAERQADQLTWQHIERLRASNEELALFNAAMVDRELRMIELKKEVNELCQRLGQPWRYPRGLLTEDEL